MRLITPRSFNETNELQTEMLKAIIFDCDGVIANSEPIHMSAFALVLAEEGINLTKEDYFDHYLALDDRGCFSKAFAQRGDVLSVDQQTELIKRKASYVERDMRESLQLLPGSAELIRTASQSYPLAVASGALRHEIELILDRGSLRDCFRVIVSAEDVERCKPDPEPFLKALQLLNLSLDPIEPAECLVIEDSIHGVRAAGKAAMRCLAVTTSYPADKLTGAVRVVDSLADISLREIEALFEE